MTQNQASGESQPETVRQETTRPETGDAAVGRPGTGWPGAGPPEFDDPGQYEPSSEPDYGLYDDGARYDYEDSELS